MAAANDAESTARPLARVFPPSADAKRDQLIQETWSGFCAEMTEAVRTAAGADRSPPEIAYAVGEIVHNYFRARGATLTSRELRHLVGELLDRHSVSKPDVLKPEVAEAEPPPRAEPPKAEPPQAKPEAAPEKVVAFAKEPPPAPWQSEETPAPSPAVPEKVFEPPPSTLVEVLDREAATFDRLLATIVEVARPLVPRHAGRDVAKAAIAIVLDKALGEAGEQLSPPTRTRLQAAALSELCGLGLIDRLWADRTVHALFVNGPSVIYAQRGGALERVAESFRSEQHLAEIVGRLAPSARQPVVEFQLRDGTSGVAVFPPAAPRGPVLALRRAEPGTASFERLIAAGMLSSAMADVIRIAARCRLNILVSGPAGAGKTALLAALARDLGEARIVTVARHRSFRSQAPTRIELVAQEPTSSLPALLAAGAALAPDLLLVDSVRLEDVPALVERLSRGARGTVAAVEPSSLASGLGRSVDLVVRLARGGDGLSRVVAMLDGAGAAMFVHEDGAFQRRSANPAFASAAQAGGLGEALAATLR
ncbi:MAG TPA: ATPase, T2SS/T4P/T4SS family [Reyranella sp.]|nr:ATPase, T2SS/T4P/T4SS family [Reyranella sp.]